MKARKLLGIGRPDPVVQWAKGKALPWEAVAVTYGVGAGRKKLIEAFRGWYQGEEI